MFSFLFGDYQNLQNYSKSSKILQNHNMILQVYLNLTFKQKSVRFIFWSNIARFVKDSENISCVVLKIYKKSHRISLLKISKYWN